MFENKTHNAQFSNPAVFLLSTPDKLVDELVDELVDSLISLLSTDFLTRDNTVQVHKTILL